MWLKILCSGRKNYSAPVPIQNGVRCLTTKLTLSFALINTNIATAKKCCWHFFVARKKERQWDLMNDTNARNSFLYALQSLQNEEDALEKCMMQIWLHAHALHTHMYAFVAIEFLYKSMSILLFCWSCLSYREMHSIQSSVFIRTKNCAAFCFVY